MDRVQAGLSVLRVDTRIDCLSDSYTVLQVGGLAAGVLWVFGVPMWWLITLVRSSEEILLTGEDGQLSMVRAYTPHDTIILWWARSVVCEPRSRPSLSVMSACQ